MSVYRPKYRDPETGKLKPSSQWWYQFTYAGKRVRESAKTSRKTIALEAEKRRHLELERANAGLPSTDTAERIRRISEALKEYAAGYSVNHRQASIVMVKNRSAHLTRLLGSAMVSDVTKERIVEYMQKRLAEEAGGRTINLEIQILASALGYTWKVLWPRVKKLEENHDVGRALDPREEQAILDAAGRNQSRLIYPFLFTLAWTGLRSDEARTLRWSQVDFSGAGEVALGGSKTEKGKGRRIPMSANLKAVLGAHASWYASKLGPIQPSWYVFPLCNRLAPTHPSKPVTSIKTAWNSIRETAKVECRLHDLRHSFCTKMAEAGVPESTMQSIMGHMSRAMLERYSHIRVQARRDAIDALESRHSSIVAGTISATVGDSSVVTKSVTH